MLFRTAEGTKLVSAAINNRVLFEADDHAVAEGWSVIVKGMARMLRTAEELAGGRAGTVAALDRDPEATLRSHSPGLDYRPPFSVRSGTRARIHVRLICTLQNEPRCAPRSLSGRAITEACVVRRSSQRPQCFDDRRTEHTDCQCGGGQRDVGGIEHDCSQATGC